MQVPNKIACSILVALVLVKLTGSGGASPFAPAGPLRIVIVRESLDTSPELARIVNALRNGPAAAYLKTKGHRLDVLDDDVVDENGKPQVAPAWVEGLALPVLVMLDGKTGRIVSREPLPATADAVLAALQAKGA